MISGTTLRTLREIQGWDQQTLAYHVGIDPSVISRLERGLQTDLKASVLIKIAQAFNISLDQLVNHHPTELPVFISELEMVLTRVHQLSPAHQRQIASILQGYVSTLPQLLESDLTDD